MAIGRGRRREHPNQHCLLLLRMLHNFRFRMPKGTPKGSSDHRSHPVAVLLLLRKKRGKKPGMRRTYFRTGPLPDRASSSHVTNVTSDQKSPLGRIWRTSSHVTSGHFRSCAMVRSPARSPANVILSVPIYYCRYLTFLLLCCNTILVDELWF